MHKELGQNGDSAIMTLQANAVTQEPLVSDGHYHVVCRDKDGNVKWEDGFENQVMQVGKILAMNTLLYTASGYTLVGPYLGLITSSTGYSATDTMASHSDWTEFTAYTVGGSAVRGTAVFATATGNNVTTSGSNVVTSSASAITYTITGSGGGGTHVYHWSEDRALTNRERARLQTFPDNFIFEGNKEAIRRQIGMAVPPEGAKVIFEAIIKTLEGIEYKSVKPNIE